MKLIYTYLFFITVFAYSATTVFGQTLPFAKDIAAFKKQDSISFPRKNTILLVGSSSFTKWKDVQEYFPGYTIINRGFGGSVLPDLIRYAKDIIIPYRPKQVLVYCGDNDLASSDTITPELVTRRFTQLFYIIRKELPFTEITYVSIKPSPSRYRLMTKMKQTNAMIRSFLKTKKNTSFIDVFQPMLLPAGKPIPEIFLSDSLHMNEKATPSGKKRFNPI